MPPSRRDLLRTCEAGLLAGVAGCASSVPVLGPDSPIAETELTVLPPDGAVAEGISDIDASPRVAFDPDEDRVVVVGALAVGSSSCDRAVLESADYSQADETLRVVVGSGRQQGAGNTCTGDESVDVYRLVVTIEGRYPTAVVATERGGEGERSTRVAFEGAGSG